MIIFGGSRVNIGRTADKIALEGAKLKVPVSRNIASAANYDVNESSAFDVFHNIRFWIFNNKWEIRVLE